MKHVWASLRRPGNGMRVGELGVVVHKAQRAALCSAVRLGTG